MLLMVLEEGVDTRYHLHYEDNESTLMIRETVMSFLSKKPASFSWDAVDNVPDALNSVSVESDVTVDAKISTLSREIGNAGASIKIRKQSLFKFIQELELFLVLSPDCVVLKHRWASAIYDALLNQSYPIIIGGSNQTQSIGDDAVCIDDMPAIYDALALRRILSEESFVDSIADIPWRSLLLEHRGDLMVWANASVTVDEIVGTYLHQVPIMFNVQNDGARQAVLRAITSHRKGNRPSFPLGGIFAQKPMNRHEPVVSLPEDGSATGVLRPDNSEALSMQDLQGQFAGKRCFIIGNGPSLKKTDLTRLKDDYTFGLNRIYLNYPNMRFEPTFYCCVNSNVLSQFAHEIDQLNSIKFVKKQSQRLLKNHWNTFFMQSQGNIRFHENLEHLTWHEGWTVTYCAMQVAYHLGFEEVILVGVDHYFKDSGEPNKAVTAQGDDSNHFHPNYFGKGVVWQYPDLERSEESYTVAKQVFEQDGRRILDATIGGHLQIFPKVDFDAVTADAVAKIRAQVTTDITFSVITPSYNQAPFIQRHLDSIRQQSYPPLEHLIFDPGSTDGSLAIFEDYCQNVDYATLINEKDKGQVDALNKGFTRVTGDVIAWVNSDDYYFNESVFQDVAHLFNTRPDIDVVYGRGFFVDESGEKVRDAYIQEDDQHLDIAFQHSVGILQPALFFRRKLVDSAGLLDLTYNFAFDYDYWIRLVQSGAKFYFLDQPLACAVLHSDSKTCSGRGTQYEETLASVKSHYGYVPVQWLNRYAEYLSDGMDGIVLNSENTAIQEQDRKQEHVSRLLKTWSADSEALQVLLNHRDRDPYQRTLNALRSHQILVTDRIIVTSFDSNYFNQGLNLIAGLHRTNRDLVNLIVVYDLGFTPFERAYLNQLHQVVVVDYPEEVCRFFEGYLAPKNYSYKCAAIAHSTTLVQPGQHVLWMDAGVTPLQRLDSVFERIEADEIFLIDHDDTPIWPFFNINFTHPEALTRMGASIHETLGNHLCSAMVGYKRGGAYQAFIDEAYILSQDEQIICWTKHLDQPVPGQSSDRKGHRLTNHQQNAIDPAQGVYHSQINRDRRAKILDQLLKKESTLTLKNLTDQFVYLGHRQDQSIYSILAARYHCPIQSAQRFCCSNDRSSWASKKNWESGGESLAIQKTTDITDVADNATVTFHHRGTFDYLDGIQFDAGVLNTVQGDAVQSDIDRRHKIAVLGHAFLWQTEDERVRDQLQDIDTMGVDGPSHEWESLSWYPTYYLYMDETITATKAESIYRLIVGCQSNGIQYFILRRQFLEYYPELTEHPSVFIWENQLRRFPILNIEPMTDESCATLISAVFGYSQIYLLGVDSHKPQGNRAIADLVALCSTPDNTLIAWAALKKRLYCWNTAIQNCTPDSALTLFPFIAFDQAQVEPAQPNRYPTTQLVDPEIDLVGGYERERQAYYDETEVVSHFLAHLPAASVMVDVGAHHGSALRHFADRNWQVFAYEPDPDNRQKLEKRANGRTNIKIDPRAVSDRPGQTLPFFTSEESTGISALSPFRESHQQRCQVTTTTVAEICAEHEIHAIDFLKIDTEGYDLMVLKGVPWDTIRPQVIECEFEDFKTVPLGYTFDDLAQYLIKQGYTVLVSEWHPVIRYGIQHDWYRLAMYPCKLADDKAWGNLLAFQDSPDLVQIAHIVINLMRLNPLQNLTQPESTSFRSLLTQSLEQAPMNVEQTSMNGKGRTDSLTTTDDSQSNFQDTGADKLSQPHSLRRRSQNNHLQANSPQPINFDYPENLVLPPEPQPGIRGLLARTIKYYSRWPLAVAVLAVGLNMAAVFDTPYRAALSGSGSALMLFLVGHAAAKADYALAIGDRAQVGASQVHENAKYTHGSIRQTYTLAKRSMNRANRAFNRVKVARDDARQAIQESNQSVQAADRAIRLVEQTSLSVQSASHAANLAKNTAAAAIQKATSAQQLHPKVDAFQREVANLSQQVKAIGQTTTAISLSKINTDNVRLFQPFDRQLSSENLEHFVNDWLKTLGLDMDRRAIGYLAHRICLCEDSCSGRLATNVQDMLLRVLVARSVQSRDLSVLEIGSLFGINLGILYETCRDFFESIHLTAIDPLDGYYGQQVTDTITNVPITPDVFYHNLRKLDVPLKDVSLLKGLSTDEKILADAGLKQYNLLVIDGDHSYGSVKFDFEHYLPAVDIGGLIIFDDYSTEHWPEVAEFVDKEVKSNPYVEFIGSSWRTGIFRVVRKNLISSF